jgi:hypothetical protein
LAYPDASRNGAAVVALVRWNAWYLEEMVTIVQSGSRLMASLIFNLQISTTLPMIICLRAACP